MLFGGAQTENSARASVARHLQSLACQPPFAHALLVLLGPAVPVAWYHGEAAQKELAAATRVKGQDEVPPASAYDAVSEPPEIREEEYGGGCPAQLVPGPAAAVIIIAANASCCSCLARRCSARALQWPARGAGLEAARGTLVQPAGCASFLLLHRVTMHAVPSPCIACRVGRRLGCLRQPVPPCLASRCCRYQRCH